MDHRSRNRKGHGERLRAELLEAASALLAESGDTRSLSVRSVVSAVGVTPPSLYMHFETKEDLVREVIELRFREFDAFLDEAEDGAPGALEALSRRCHAYVSYGLEHQGHYRVMFSAVNAGPAGVGTEGRVVHPGLASYLALVEVVRRCFEGTGAGAPRIENRAIAVWSGLHGIVDLMITKPDFPWPAAGALVELIVEGVERGVERRKLPQRRPGRDTGLQ